MIIYTCDMGVIVFFSGPVKDLWHILPDQFTNLDLSIKQSIFTHISHWLYPHEIILLPEMHSDA